MSLVLNLAEGAGEFSAAEKRRFYRMSLRSGNECAAVLDVARILNLVDPSSLDTVLAELNRTVAMLTRLAMR